MSRVKLASHVHSDWSYDGSWSLEALAQAFGERGYDAVLMAEHDRGFSQERWTEYRAACAAASTAGTRLIPGIEYSDPTNSVHVPVWGDIPFLGEGLETAELLPRASAAGGIAVLAHPGRRDALGRVEPELLSHLTGVELWNRKYDGYAPNGGSAALLRARPELLPFASLDFHTARQFHPLAMLVELDGGPTESAVCAALGARRAQATAFGVRAVSLAHGPAWPAMCGLERARKGAAKRLRRVRRAPVPGSPKRFSK
jgi:hypothetical protein